MNLLAGLVALIVLSASPEEDDPHYVFADLTGGRCVLHNFGKSSQGRLRGFRVWSGSEAMVLCSYHASDRSHSDPNVHIIDASGLVHCGSERPVHYELYSAFFDANGSLIACSGGRRPGSGPTKPPHVDGDVRFLPIPVGIHEDVQSYRAAYYESDLPIGARACEDNALFTTIRPAGGSEALSDASNSERAAEFRFKVRKGSHLVFQNRGQNWRAETTEDEYDSFESTPEFGSRAAFDESKYDIKASKSLKIEVRCSFTLDKGNAIQPRLKLMNPTDGRLSTQIYLAFLDKDGHLVCGTEFGTRLEPQETSWQYTTPLPVPGGLEKRIASYKITVYESARPIGELEMTR